MESNLPTCFGAKLSSPIFETYISHKLLEKRKEVCIHSRIGYHNTGVSEGLKIWREGIFNLGAKNLVWAKI